MNNQKSSMRAQIRSRNSVTDERQLRICDKQIINNLIQHPVYQSHQRIFLYVGIRSEIHTTELIEMAMQQGKMIALPRSYPNGNMEFYRFDGRYQKGMYHIPEPVTMDLMEPTMNDLIIVPGLGFDIRGYRLGQGGGYYDRYLAGHPCVSIGVCRESDILKEIPVQWNDIAVDFVITENTVYECNKQNGASGEAPLD